MEEIAKMGRPLMADDVLSKPITVNFTENEKEKLIEDAAGVTLSTFLRKKLKESGII